MLVGNGFKVTFVVKGRVVEDEGGVGAQFLKEHLLSSY